MSKIIWFGLTILITYAAVNNPAFSFSNLNIPGSGSTSKWYLDSDGDGYGDPNISVDNSPSPFLYVQNSSDCDDSNENIHPGAKEIFGDGIDSDCDGSDSSDPIWYLDADGDGYGDAAQAKQTVFTPTGYVADKTDCDDTDGGIHPGATEIPGDGVDQDCDGSDPQAPKLWYPDSDGDLYGDKNAVPISSATQIPGFTTDNTDCNDNDPNAYPGGTEIAGDGIDQDCNGSDPFLTGQLVSSPESGIAPVSIKFYTFMPFGTAPFTYNYSFGDGNQKLDASKQESHTYQQKGTYAAKVEVIDAKGFNVELTGKIVVLGLNDLATLQSDLAADADQVEKVTVAVDIDPLLDDAQNIINTSLKSLSNADAALRASIEDSVRTDAEELISNTREKLGIFLQNDQIQPNDINDIARGVKDVVSNMVRNSLPVSEQTLSDVETISGDIFSFNLDSLLANENLTSQQIEEIKRDKAKARAFFQNKSYLLDDVVDTSGIEVDVKINFNADDINTIGSNHGLTGQQTAKLFNSVETTNNVNQTIALNSVSKQTIAETAEKIFNIYYSGISVTNAFVDPVTKNILLEFNDGTYISFLVRSISIVGDHTPEGLFTLPDGTQLGVTESYAVKFVAYPVFPMDVAAELIKAGVDTTLGGDGSLSVGLSSNKKLSTRIGWEYFQNNIFNSLTASFSVTGGADPSAEAYSLLVTYDTGLSQLLPPAVHAFDALTSAFDSFFPADYSIDNDTGVITVGTLTLKPDYEFTSMKSIDYNLITASGGLVLNKIGFGIKDYNNDGLIDFGFYSDNPMGFQILYTISY